MARGSLGSPMSDPDPSGAEPVPEQRGVADFLERPNASVRPSPKLAVPSASPATAATTRSSAARKQPPATAKRAVKKDSGGAKRESNPAPSVSYIPANARTPGGPNGQVPPRPTPLSPAQGRPQPLSAASVVGSGAWAEIVASPAAAAGTSPVPSSGAAKPEGRIRAWLAARALRRADRGHRRRAD